MMITVTNRIVVNRVPMTRVIMARRESPETRVASDAGLPYG
jgi:hypothetical protein